VKVEAIIVGGGKGTRFGNNLPKQFCPIAGEPILNWTLSRFENCPSVNSIILVVPEGMGEKAKNKLSLFKYKKLKMVTEGGRERTDSAYQGFVFVDEDTQIVLIHDGVRPLVSSFLINSVIEQTKIYGAVTPGIPIKETVKEKDKHDQVTKTLPRDRLCLIQTPQGFKYNLIKNAYAQAKSQNWKASDDTGLLEKLNQKVQIIPGEETNIKITTFFDFKLAEILLQEEQNKI